MPTPIRPHQRPLARDKYENFSRPAKAKLGKLLRVLMIRYILISNSDESQWGFQELSLRREIYAPRQLKSIPAKEN